MTIEQALEQLRDARSRKMNWLQVSQILSQVIEDQVWRQSFNSPSEWLAAAAEATGFSENWLRRYLSAHRFLRAWDRDRPELGIWRHAEEVGLHPSAAEMLKRLNDVDKARAEEMFRQAAEGRAGYTQIKRAYDAVMAPPEEAEAQQSPFQTFDDLPRQPDFDPASYSRKVAARRGRVLEAKAGQLVADHLGELSGGSNTALLTRHYKFSFAEPDAVAVGRSGFSVRWVDGYRFLNFFERNLNRSLLLKSLAETSLACTFFRRYWLIIDGPRQSAEELIEQLHALHLNSVGVALIERTAALPTLTILTKPTLDPQPDRQEEVRAEVFQQGVPV